MQFNEHKKLEGAHAFLSPSKYHWVGYSLEKLRKSYINSLAVERGVRLHAFAKSVIENGVKLSNSKQALNRFVNDAIGYRMSPEVVLYYSKNCFGTVDAICYRDGILRIHDLKTGETKASFNQLIVYAALFFLEYREYSLNETEIELRIYQGTGVKTHRPDPQEIEYVMEVIQRFDKEIDKLKERYGSE